MKSEKPCIATKETPNGNRVNYPVGYVRKLHRFSGGDFCVYCDTVRR